ncbi:N-acetylmuramoyl-L-alanine amidase-like domain-containing protein [Marinomonas sp.]|uniref:N-acetylmuramoyl-L-alanine amidase-like domain-containing protein n=1 Tax=Marinomonas sp. TaxID=1904862 RepID=UPI003BAD3600
MTLFICMKKILLVGVAALSSFMASANSIDDVNKVAFFKTMNSNVDSLSLSNISRIAPLSQVFLGAKYVGGNVGEGEQGLYDKDPLTRFDVFDCTTYVETVLAGAMSASASEFEQNLMRLRYKDGKVSFVTRNHFPSLDWFHNNRDKLLDITPDVANGGAKVAEAVIDKSAWYKHLSDDVLHCDATESSSCRSLLMTLHSEGKAFKPETAYLPYVPLSLVFQGNDRHVNQALLDRIPSGSVISMVRPNWSLKQYIGTNMNVSHQGLAIRKNGILFLRHASLTHKKVTDENFAEYFSHYPETSSLKGFNVQVLRH